MTIRAGIDCGTNSIRLLVIDEDGRELVRRNTITRLGTGVDRTGVFDRAALDKSIRVIDEYARICRETGVGLIRFAATSATRDAANRDEFIGPVAELIGGEPEVISGIEEASLSFAGAIGALPELAGSRTALVDLGGGSTEVALGAGVPDYAYSMNIGSVRLTERWLASDPPTAAERARLVQDARLALDQAVAVVPVGAAETLVGVSGTIATVTSYALRLPQRDPSAIQGAVLPVEEVLAAADDLGAMSREQIAALPFIHPGRVAVTAAGALIWREVVARVVRETAGSGAPIARVTTSLSDILDGLAASAAQPFASDSPR